MRRLFSTVYRLLLTAAAISALALSILSATSCDFLAFVHPYEANGRSLIHQLNTRQLQTPEDVNNMTLPEAFNPDEGDLDKGDLNEGDPEGDTTTPTIDEGDPEGDTTTPTTVGLVNTDYLAQLADSISQVGLNLTDDLADEAASQAAGVVAATINATDETASPSDVDLDKPDASAKSPGSVALDEETVGDTVPLDDESSSGGKDSSLDTDDFIVNIPTNVYGQNTSASVAISGSAGLFCAANDMSIVDVWKGTFVKSEVAIDEASNSDESEDIARNGAVVAITFGAVIAFILLVETIFGWRVCCEKWIVGILAQCACFCQGLSFLFFNSERYCDANIIHEILDRKPCVLGAGATYSVVALLLYASIIVLVCCAPSADPYHLLCCCRAQKESNATNGNFSSLELAESKNSGFSNESESNVALSGRDHDKPAWLSEEKREQKGKSFQSGCPEDENEII